MTGKCVFNKLWLQRREYQEWLLMQENRYKAKCSVCNKFIDISRMGESTLKVYMKGTKHLSLCEAKKSATVVMTEFKKAGGSGQTLGKAEAPSKDSAISISNVAPLDKMCAAGNSVLNTEILWMLKCVQSHLSYSSCKDTSEIFAAMFPDSSIECQFSCGESKLSYLCYFGLAPHFRMLLFKCLDDVKSYTLLFNESIYVINGSSWTLTCNFCTPQKIRSEHNISTLHSWVTLQQMISSLPFISLWKNWISLN
ncbi:hypothetical protein AVEN_170500-1 [Araneus ventricosus]|uniref:BED-type domain-containing protein n=1 Tax=Araneus ventricosus TaxID=182803 RepID=A0A4Y2BYV9_ARAVE|nr:hypothetical protein AVEN_170500-1 [Araneus ventricosus]